MARASETDFDTPLAEDECWDIRYPGGKRQMSLDPDIGVWRDFMRLSGNDVTVTRVRLVPATPDATPAGSGEREDVGRQFSVSDKAREAPRDR